jgi:hypothetical protein
VPGVPDAPDPAAGTVPPPTLPDGAAFAREVTPTWLATVALLAGQRPPELDGPLRVAHLGCGRGETAAVVAAVHPEAHVLAWDWRPEHVEVARRTRDAAGLANLTVHEWPELPADLGGPTDIVVVHGVLAASDDEQRAALGRAIRAGLRPGGLVCVAYPTLAGWSEVAPVQSLLRELALQRPGPPEQVVAAGLDLLGRLRQGGARFLTGRPVVASWVDHLATLPPHLVAATYLRDPFRPTSPAQVATLLGEAGCTFVGSARVSDELCLGLPDAVADQIDAVEDRVLRETYRDLALRTSHRLDVYRRGDLPLSVAQQVGIVADLPLVGVAPPGAVPPAGLPAATWERLQGEGLLAGALDPDLQEAARRLRVLLDAGHAHPVLTAKPTEAAATACDALNVHWAGEHVDGSPPWRARADLGTAVPADAAAAS